MKRQDRITNSDLLSIRSSEDESGQFFFTGYAALFDDPTDIGGWFYESIHKDAFNSALARKDDVRAIFNHDPNLILGRTKSGSLSLEVDETGLKSTIRIPDTTLGKDLKYHIEQGDISQMSFGFIILKEERKGLLNEKPWYEIQDVELFDVSPVTYPAYANTNIEVKRQKAIESRVREIMDKEGRAKAGFELRTRKINLLNMQNDT